MHTGDLNPVTVLTLHTGYPTGTFNVTIKFTSSEVACSSASAKHWGASFGGHGLGVVAEASRPTDKLKKKKKRQTPGA